MRILLIDDNSDNLVTLDAILKTCLPECETVKALSGQDGIALAQSLQPDTILLDVQMPKTDGFEVCRRLKGDPLTRHIPIIFLTAHRTDTASRIRGLELGGDAFLTKPVDPAELTAQVKVMLRIKRAEDVLRVDKSTLEGLYKDLVASQPAGVYRVHVRPMKDWSEAGWTEQVRARCTFELVSDRFCDILGVSAAALCADASAIAKSIFPEDRPSFIARSVQALLSSQPFSWDGRILKQGRPSWVHFASIARRLENGNTLLTGIVLDVDARKRAEEELKRTQAGLAQADRLSSMGLLAAGVAHEINNPLTFVLFTLETLSQGLLPRLVDLLRRSHVSLSSHERPEALPQLLRDLQECLHASSVEDLFDRSRDALVATHRIKDIVRSLGTFARVEATQTEPVDIRASIEHAMTMASNELKYRARAVKELSPVPEVLGSEGNLAQVFLNLIINAAHAIPEGRVESNEVRVRTWAEGDDVLAEVRDTGRGIAAECRARIFEPFFTTKSVGIGSGLGLSICKKIITELGGDISFTSELGRGTSFVVRLHRIPNGWKRQDDATPEHPPVRPTERGRILVVDDEAGIRAVLTRLLGEDHEVIAAASGNEARSLLARDRAFDLIFCDLMMPDVSGMDLHAWLTTHDPQLAEQVVFITGGAFTPGASEYLKRVGSLRVEKPFDAMAFRKMTSELMIAARSKRLSAGT